MWKNTCSIGLAALLWFLMFSPWTAPYLPFWPSMAVSSCLLLLLTSIAYPRWNEGLSWSLTQIALGICIAVGLWGVFWIGDKLSSLLFDFARPQVDAVYALKDGSQKLRLSAQLLLLTGPAEEIFWRGCIQQSLGRQVGSWKGAVLTLIAYTLIHLWSLNFMLIMAAMVAGACWGLLYLWKPHWLPALILSHALWDAAVFVWFPL